jgi:probable HAF family extracellular repeat protein
MKSILIWIVMGSLLATSAEAQPASYTVIDLGALKNGPFSMAHGESPNGIVNGVSGLPDGSQHAVLWYRASIIDLATPGLGGPNSAAFGVNAVGLASGLTETSAPDPHGEDFCGFGTFRRCLPFLWYGGIMYPLPTLGNTENTNLDATCPAGGPQRFQEKPVLWRNRQVIELPTYPGDPDGWAFGINDSGQVAGASGICSPLNPDTGVYILSRHALLWDGGKPIDLGNLGGTGAFGPGNIALEVNNQGEVVGASDLADNTTFHAFRWTGRAGIKDLGTLRGDFASAGLAINDDGIVVGASFDADFNPRAFLWRKGVMTDLNTLIPANSPFVSLLFAHGINSRGEIVGFGVNNDGAVHGFLAVPKDARQSLESGEPEIRHWTGPVVAPEAARIWLFRLLRTPEFGPGSARKP